MLTSRTSSAYRARCPGTVSNDGRYHRGGGVDWPHEKKHMTLPSVHSLLTDSYQYHNDNHIRR